jgi:hypothetical protein
MVKKVFGAVKYLQFGIGEITVAAVMYGQSLKDF